MRSFCASNDASGEHQKTIRRNSVSSALLCGKALPPDEQRVILATGSFIGEGFDDSRLDTLFLAMPVAFKGKLHQYVGRILQPNADKDEVRVYDYVDTKVPMLKRMFKKRLRAYRAIGFEEESFKVKKRALVKVGLTRSRKQSLAC